MLLALTQAAFWSQLSLLIDHGYWIAKRVFQSPPYVACRDVTQVVNHFSGGWLCMIDQPLQWRGVQPTLLVYGGNCLAPPVWVVMHPVRSSLVMFSSSEACSHWLNKVAQITTAKCFQYCFVIVRSDEVEVGYCSACAILLTCHTLLLNTRIPLQFNTQWWMTTVDEDLSQPGASYPSFTGWQAYAAHELLK